MRSIAELISLRDRVAVITGGAGHIGRGMAEALAELGCTVCLIDRNDEMLAASVEALKSLGYDNIQTLKIDLEDESQRCLVADWIEKKFGRLDILINNAGFVGDSQLQGWVAPFEEQSVATWRRAIEVNLTAAFHLSQSLAALMRKSEHASIINVASIYGVVGPDMHLYDDTKMGNPAAYAISKGGLIQMTRWLSTVLAPHIRVNCISPGGVARNQPDVFVQKYEARTPMRRMGKEEDLRSNSLLCQRHVGVGYRAKPDGRWWLVCMVTPLCFLAVFLTI